MSRARNRRLRVACVLALLGLGSGWVVACGGPQSLGGSGSVCFRDDDCQAGLACVPASLGSPKHVCSADLSGIVPIVDAAAPEPDPGDTPEASGGTPGAGAPGTGGDRSGTASAGKPATGGAPGAAGAATSGGAGSAGASAGGAAAGGAAAAAAAAGAATGGAAAGAAG